MVVTLPPSRYHAARQNDGRGWMLIRLEAIGSAEARIIDANLTEQLARERLADLRAAEAEEAIRSPWAS